MKNNPTTEKETPHAPGTGSDKHHPETPDDADQRFKQDKKNIQEKSGLTDKSISIMAKELDEKQTKLIESISQELAKLDENELITLLKKIDILNY